MKQIKDKPKSAKAAAKPNKQFQKPILSEHKVKGGLDLTGVSREEMIANSFIYQPIYRNEEAISAVKAFVAAQNHGAGVFDGGVSPRHSAGALESPRYFGGFS